MLKHWHRLLLSVSVPLMAVALESTLATAPGRAAEQVEFKYGPFARSVAVSSLRTYAETGEAPADLAPLLRFVKQADREALKQNLSLKLPINVVTVNRIISSPNGQKLVTEVARTTVVRPENAAPLALQGGLLLSAASEQGFGILSFLEAYPLRTLTVNIPAVQELAKSSGGLQGLLGNLLKPQ